MRVFPCFFIVAIGILVSSCAGSSSDGSPLFDQEPSSYPPAWYVRQVEGVDVVFLPDTNLEADKKVTEAIEEAMRLLPEDFADTLQGLAAIYVSGAPTLCSDDWASGCAGKIQVSLHETANAASYPFPWTHYAQDGYTYVERLKITIHEFGHVISFANEYELLYSFPQVGEEKSPTRYGATSYHEDFADSFTFYVLWPEYLKQCCPLRYAFMQQAFGMEYANVYPMPSSICDRLFPEFEPPTECQE